MSDIENIEREKDVSNAANFIRDNARKFAVAKAESIYLEHYRTALRGDLIKELIKSGIKGAETLKAYAEADEKYKTVLRGWREAIADYEELRLLVKAAELKIELFRTKASTQRAEMNLR